jgi:hypothetical protein
MMEDEGQANDPRGEYAQSANLHPAQSVATCFHQNK